MSRFRNYLKNFILLCLIIYAGIIGYFYTFQRSFLYFPEKANSDLSDSIELKGVEGVYQLMLKTADGIEIQTWYKEPSEKGKPMILYLHGNSSNLVVRSAKFRWFADHGYGFIAPCWRGFGMSGGYPTKAGLLEDARTAISYLKSKGYNTEDVILIGESLGSGIATQMAIENKFMGVELITPYVSIAKCGIETYPYIPVGPLLKDNFQNAPNIGNIIPAPVLIVHGDADTMITPHHAFEVMRSAKAPKRLVMYSNVGHTNYIDDEVFKEMEEFIYKKGYESKSQS